MKYLILVLVFGLVPTDTDQTKLVAEYYGGRSGYWHHSLRLYDNSVYSYKKWIHTRFSLRDSGTYEMSDTAIRLTSLETEVNQGGLTKKAKRDFEKARKGYKRFSDSTFRRENNKIYLSRLSKLKDSSDSIEFQMGILYEIAKD